MHTDIIDEIAKASVEQLEYEILGAWRAGYDYLHVCERPNTHSFGYKRRVKPSNREKPPRTYRKRSWSVETYDLRWLFPQDVRELSSVATGR